MYAGPPGTPTAHGNVLAVATGPLVRIRPVVPVRCVSPFHRYLTKFNNRTVVVQAFQPTHHTRMWLANRHEPQKCLTQTNNQAALIKFLGSLSNKILRMIWYIDFYTYYKWENSTAEESHIQKT